MKRMIASLCVLSLMFSFASCSKQADYSNQTITGQVTAIDGTKITLQLGELTEQNMQMQSNQFATFGEANENSDGQTPPEMPDGEQHNDGQTPPDKPDGEQQGDAQTPPDLPNGEMSGGGETPPDMPNGEMPQGGGDMQKPDRNDPMNSFTAGEETVTLDFDGAEIKVESGMEIIDGTLKDISVGSILVVEVGKKNMAKTATVKFTGGMEMPGDMPGGGTGGFDSFGSSSK